MSFQEVVRDHYLTAVGSFVRSSEARFPGAPFMTVFIQCLRSRTTREALHTPLRDGTAKMKKENEAAFVAF